MDQNYRGTQGVHQQLEMAILVSRLEIAVFDLFLEMESFSVI